MATAAGPGTSRHDEVISLAPHVVMAIVGGKVPEPPVSNLEYLTSYERFGLWMRLLNAYRHMLAVEKAPKDGLARIASVAGLMEQYGMFMEDVTSMVIVLCAWAKRRDLLIADLLRGLNLRNGPVDTRPASTPYHETCLEPLIARGRSTVNPRQFFDSTETLGVDGQARLLGVAWPVELSALTDDEHQRWHRFGESISSVFDFVGQDINQISATAYNKIKHGPQAVVCSMRSVVLRRDAHQSLAEYFEPDHLHLRLLFDGSRTQETVDDTTADGPKPVAPYVPDDEDNLLRTMFRMLVIATSLQPVVHWLLRAEYGWSRTTPRDPDLAAMCDSLAARVDSLAPQRNRHAREFSITMV